VRVRPYIIAAALAAACFVYLLSGFVAGLGAYGAAASKADAIVVLTGGKGRVEEGLRLFRTGLADVLILSGVNSASDLDSIFISSHLGDGERERIVLEKNSRSTYGNAVEVGRIVRDRGIGSLILLTSGYHMKRAERTFRRVLPAEVSIKPYAVGSPNFDGERWWQGTTLWISLVEFVKYYWYEARFAVGRGAAAET